MKKVRKNMRAFTLIETLLYIGIVGIVLSALVGFGWNMMGLGIKGAVRSDTVSNGRFVSERLSFFIREAVDINVAQSNFGVNLATVPGSKLTLRGVAPNDPVVFDISGGVLRVAFGASAPVALTSSNVVVNSLIFTNASSVDGKAKNVGFEIQLGTTVASNRFEYASNMTLRSSAEIRSNTQ